MILQAGNCTMSDLKFSIEPNGVKVTYAANCTKNTVQIPGINGTYEALQFHIHTSSEHTINNRFYGAELHIVHKATDAARYAVVGMEIGATSPTNNELFEVLLDGWDNVTGNTYAACGLDTPEVFSTMRRSRASGSGFNVYDLLEENSTFYTYDGSLTTPPVSTLEKDYRYYGHRLCAMFLMTDSAFRYHSAQKLSGGTLQTNRSSCRSCSTRSSFPSSSATSTRPPASLPPLHR
jgi:Eukaryotic-type carbonic anhydrase